ncbi:GNAT family N-acetyltransferase [Roseiarcus sp.]|uniref:GNAT family N-acetyltransferase n=1 Tax=Roseiarcus sp. TaxID=1969460 RepID=UPI003F9B7551
MQGMNFAVRTFDGGTAAEAAAGLLALNNAHAAELSRLSPKAMARLIDRAFLACRIGEADAFLIAFDEAADYDSPNFLWFRGRFDRFVYVDRVAVAFPARGRGFGRALYEALFERARAAGHVRIVCEVNADPPNSASDAFHAAMGFAVIGWATIDRGKTVRYYARALHGAST